MVTIARGRTHTCMHPAVQHSRIRQTRCQAPKAPREGEAPARIIHVGGNKVGQTYAGTAQPTPTAEYAPPGAESAESDLSFRHGFGLLVPAYPLAKNPGQPSRAHYAAHREVRSGCVARVEPARSSGLLHPMAVQL